MLTDGQGTMKKYDIIIIGGGVSGAAVARELSRYDAKILLLEKEEDLCAQTSKANSGIVHAGYDAAPVRIGDIVLSDVAGTGVNVIATKNADLC